MSPQHPESQEHQQHLPQRPRGTAGTGSMVPSQNHGMPGWEGTFKPTSFHPPAMGTFHQTRLLYLALNPSRDGQCTTTLGTGSHHPCSNKYLPNISSKPTPPAFLSFNCLSSYKKFAFLSIIRKTPRLEYFY